MFNPNEHMMQLKGKDYLQVAWRLVWFREEHPDWAIDAQALTLDEDHAIFKASIYDDQGHLKSTGHGSESQRDFGDFLEKAETKAIGRALAMLGYGTQFAGNELDEGARIVDSPIERAKQEQKKSPAPAPTKNKFNARKAATEWVNANQVPITRFTALRDQLIAEGVIANKNMTDLTPEEFDTMIIQMLNRGIL